MEANLFARIETAVADLHSVCISTPDGDKIAYKELFERTGQVANALVSMGLRPGDRLAAQVEKSVAAIVLYLATIRAGGVFLPLNTAYTPHEIEYFLGDAEPTLFVCDPRAEAVLSPVASAAGAVVKTLDSTGQGSLEEEASIQDRTFETVPRAADDLAAMLYTSGTTGRSKGAMLTHNNLFSNANTLRDAWRFSEQDVLIHALPIFHTHGLFVAINVSFLAGAQIILLDKFDPNEVIRQMPKATVLMGVPTFYVRLLEDARIDRALTDRMRLFVSGSAPLLEETHRSWHERTGHMILERYGMTETNMNTTNPYEGERMGGTVGKALPGVEVRIADPDTGLPVTDNQIGMIEVRGPNVFKGYWKMPERTAAEFRSDGFFITGDLGKIDHNGYIRIVGRGKDLIITGGYNVYPKEVESEIDLIDGVLESAVIGLPHADFGEAVTGVIVLRAGSSLDGADVLARLAGRLAKYKQPKKVVFVKQLPRNTMGKVQKNVLRETYADLYSGNKVISSEVEPSLSS